MSVDLQPFAEFAAELADELGAFIRPLFRRPLDIVSKADESPVTEADRGAEQVMRKLINARFPDHGIVGEEFGAENADAEFVWHLDPIDGTKSFISGSAQFVTLIALTRHNRPVLGVINQPVNNERWIGIEGQKTTFNGKPVSVRKCPDIADATLYTWGAEILYGPRGPAVKSLIETVRLTRFSADGYAYGLLALGFVDIVADEGMKPHDYLALAPVVKGAGGHITDWQGREIEFGIGEKTLAVGDRTLHEAALNILQG
ncbi:MAG: inositol monophosphatase family protein [Minwuia sp.]|uniref:inositol monophosphatase family protein n=1 Tax=Minwuia sp. TaxID=2493630 RepID=UPI003A86EF2E